MPSLLNPSPLEAHKIQRATVGNLAWTALKNHCLLTPVRVHDSGDGALLWLSLLGRCFTVPALKDWAQENQKLIQALRHCQLRNATALTSRLEQDSLWSAIADCINARQRAVGNCVSVDELLARYVIGLGAEKALASASFFFGLTQLYKASRSENTKSVRRDWRNLLEVLQASDGSLAGHILTIQMEGCRNFAISADRIRKTPIISVRSAVSIEVLSDLLKAEHARDKTGLITVAQDVAEGGHQDVPQKAAVNVESGRAPIGFIRGDSLSEYIRRQAPFTSRRIRLGLERKSSAPLTHIREIVRLCFTEIGNASDPVQLASGCLLQLQLCIPLPFDVLLSLRCQACDDLWLDIPAGALSVSRRHMTGSASKPDWFASTGTWSIPLPSVAVGILAKLFKTSPEASFLGDVFSHNDIDLKELETAHHQLLKRYSDTNLQIWPGQWIEGISAAAIQVLGSELSAAYVLSHPGLSANGALHYFHPRQVDLDTLVRKWLAFFGLKDSRDQTENQGQELDIFDNDRLSSGFNRLLNDIQELQASLSKHRGSPTELLGTFKDLTTRSAALLVFVTGSRGHKLDELKCGSLLSHDELIHIDDKDVVDGRGSRLIPRPNLLLWVMKVYIDAQRTLAKRLCRLNSACRTDTLVELSKEDLRFDAVCFQYFERRVSKIERVAVVAADIEKISRHYFAAPRNFMRHVLITHWTLSSYDKTALRALTGHAWAWAEAPGPCSTYSPESLILSIKKPLEQLLAIWIKAPTNTPRHMDWPIQRLPMRRVVRVQGYYRKFILDGVQGPVLSRWHLAATAFSESVRHELVSGELSLSPVTQLWLYLAFVEGLTEHEDLDAILSDPKSITKGARGWKARWARLSDRTATRCIHLQAPTTLFLEDHQLGRQAIAPADTESELSAWLCARFPGLKTKNNRPTLAKAICLSAAALWADLVLPTGNQTAYAVANNAPIVSRRTAEALIDDTRYHAQPTSYIGPQLLHPRHHSSQLQRLMKLIHRTGDNNQRLGEQKARAVYFLEHLDALGSLEDGSWPSILATTVGRNIELIRAGRKALEFSSISTYTSTLSDFLSEHKDLNLKEVSALEIKLLSKELLSLDKEKNGLRNPDISAAAQWLLRGMSKQGFPVLLTDLGADDWHIRQTSAQSIPLITASVMTAAKSLFISTHQESPLSQEQIQICIDLLLAVPLRWMEVATLDPTHILEQHQDLRIEASGFSHIKSSSSTRTLTLPSDLHIRLQTLARRVMELHRTSRPLLFSVSSSGSDSASVPAWLREEMVWVMKYILEDDFRVHHFRSNTVSNLLFPGWRDAFERWTHSKASGVELSRLFEYAPKRAWHAEQIAILAGHSHPVVTVCYYLFTWPFLRSLAMASLNSRLVPRSRYLARHGVSQAALDKASQRDEAVSTNKWNYLVSKKRGRANPVLLGTPDVAPPRTLPESSDHNSPPSVDGFRSTQPTGTLDVCDFRYLCLRTCGVSPEKATDFSEVGRDDRHRLELYLAEVTAQDIKALRARDGNSSGDRSTAAEVGLIQSELFARIFLTLAKANAMQLSRLLGLLAFRVSRQPSDEDTLISTSKLFDGSPFLLEVVFGKRHFEPHLVARLSNTTSLRIGQPVRDLGSSAKAFIIPRDEGTNLVIKSRLRSVSAQLCFHLHQHQLPRS